MRNEISRVVDALPGLVWTALPDGHIDYLNHRWCEYTGLGAEEACGWGWQTAVHPEDLPGLLEGWRSMVASGQPRDMEARLRRFDGEYRWFLFRICPLASAPGRIVKWCGVNTDIEDRKRAEEALRASECRFRLVVDGLPTLVTLRTPTGDLEFANRHVLEYTGETLEELQGLETTGAIHPDDHPHLLAAWKDALLTARPYDIEVRRRRADGVYRWFHNRGLPLRDGDGRIVVWYLMGTDIDDQKRAEALLAGEKRLLEMVATGESLSAVLTELCQLAEDLCSGYASCSILLSDSGTHKLWHAASPTVPRAYPESIDGLPSGPYVGTCGTAAHCEEQPIAADIATDLRRDELRDSALTPGLRAYRSVPIFSRQNQVLGTVTMFFSEPAEPTERDQEVVALVTRLASIAIERAQGEAALGRSEAFLAKAQRLSSSGSFSWRVAMGEFTWSEEVYRIFDLDPALPVTLELMSSRVHPEDVPLLHDMVVQAQAGKDFEYEHRLQIPDGSVKHLHIAAHGITDHNGQLEYIGAVQDVTEHRLAEEALGKVRSELAHVARVTTLGALTASIAHEVNQPLSGIITNAGTCLRMLAADPPNVDGARETARRTIRDGNRAADVITRLRALFSKKDATTETVDLNAATQEVTALSSGKLQSNRVILRSELDADLPLVTGDRIQLQQVILNLLMNASEAMSDVNDRPRELVIRTERDLSGGVRLAVQDSGTGFDPQSMDRLFEAFCTTKNGGMGIGLSVSRSIIESHHGRLWAALNDGPGATFSFSIPRKPEGQTGADSGHNIGTPSETDAA